MEYEGEGVIGGNEVKRFFEVEFGQDFCSSATLEITSNYTTYYEYGVGTGPLSIDVSSLKNKFVLD